MCHEPFSQTKDQTLFGMISAAVRRLPKKMDATILPNSQASEIQWSFRNHLHCPNLLHGSNPHPKIRLPFGPAPVSSRAVQEQKNVRR
jgi:hypothetical protein